MIDSILMPGVMIGKGAKVHKSVIGDGAFVGANTEIGAEEGINDFLDNKICSKDISLIGPEIYIDEDIKIMKNSHIGKGLLTQDSAHADVVMEAVKEELVYA